jgi:hypothetical protein
MTLKPLVTAFLILAGLAGIASWREERQRARAAGSAFVDTALLEPSDLQRAHRIIVREKPQTKVVHKEEGFEVKRIVEKDAPVRETILRREGSTWVVASYFDLEADMDWVGQTMRDLSQGRLTRYVTSDPQLMTDLGLGIGLVRLEDEHGTVIRQLELGGKDGGDTYQFVRVNGDAAYVAKHEAEILGDSLAWIVTRIFRFDPADVREIELPFQDGRAVPIVLRRSERGAPLRPPSDVPNPALVSERAEQVLGKLLSEQVMMAVRRDHPGAAAARGNVGARIRLVLFDGRDYKVGYGLLPAGDRSFGADVRSDDVIVLDVACSDPKDLTQRYLEKAALVYSRGATLGRLPKDRAALVSPPPAAPADRPGRP